MIVDKINVVEKFILIDKFEEEKQAETSDFLSSPDCSYKVVISLQKFIHMVYEFLRLINSFP